MESGTPPLSPGISDLLAGLYDVTDEMCVSRGSSVLVNGDVSSHNTAVSGGYVGDIPVDRPLTLQLQPGNFPETAALPQTNHGVTYPTNMPGQPDAGFGWAEQVLQAVNAGAFLYVNMAQPNFHAGAGALVPQSLGSSDLGGTSCGPNGRRGRKAKPRMPDLELQLDQLTTQFRQLSKENGFLRNKLKALERVVPYREAFVGFLSSVQALQASDPAPSGSSTASGAPTDALLLQALQQPATAPVIASASSGETAERFLAAGPAGAASVGPAATAAISSSNTSSNSNNGFAGGVPAAAHQTFGVQWPPAAAYTTIPGTTGTSRVSPFTPGSHGQSPLGTALLAGGGSGGGDGWLPQPQDATPAATSGGADGMWAPPAHPRGTPLVLALCPGPDGEVPPIDPSDVEQLKRTTAKEFCMLWKHQVLQLGVLAASAEAFGPGSPQHARLERFLQRAFAYMDRICMLAPTCILDILHLNLETGQPERPRDEFWAGLGAMMNLSKEQVSQVSAMATLFAANVEPVLKERTRLASELSARIVASQQGAKSGDALQVLAEVDELAEQLRRNVLKEHQAHWNITDFLCYSVLTPLQLSKVVAACYPYFPDAVAIMHATKLRAVSRPSVTEQAAAAAATMAVPGAMRGTSQQ